jgi:hypothetical protein
MSVARAASRPREHVISATSMPGAEQTTVTPCQARDGRTLLKGGSGGTAGTDAVGRLLRQEVMPLKFKPAYSVSDLHTRYLDELDKEAERKGRALQAWSDPFSRMYKVSVLAA